jgi:hypothetical protein
LSQPLRSMEYGSRKVMLIPTAAAVAAIMTSRCWPTMSCVQNRWNSRYQSVENLAPVDDTCKA